MSLSKRAIAEFFGTFWLVFGGCGAAVLDAAFPQLGIGFLGVALAFGLTLLTMAFAIGHISGCHLNPAVSAGLVVGKRFPASEFLPYAVAQVLGGIAGAGTLYVIASGKAGFDLDGGFASNGYGAHSPGGYPLLSCLVAEVVLTFFFSDDHHGIDGQAGSGGVCADRDRARTDADSPHWNSGNQSFGEPGAEHGTGGFRGRMGPFAIVAVLAGPDCGRSAGGRILSRGVRGVSGNGGNQSKARGQRCERLFSAAGLIPGNGLR